MNRSMVEVSEAEATRLVTRYLWLVISPLLLTLGTVGNVLSILVMSSRNLRSSQASVYLIALAISDIVVLYTGLLRQFLRHAINVDVRQLSELGCKIHLMLVYVSLDVSVWILVAFTFERILSVFVPYKVKRMCTRMVSFVVIISIAVILMGLNSHFLYGFEMKVSKLPVERKVVVYCYYIDDDYGRFLENTWPWIDFSVFSLMPFSILIVGNTCIATRVVVSNKRARQGPTSNSSQIQRPQSSSYGQNALAAVPNYPAPRTKVKKTSTMTAVLLLLNVVFLVTTTPVSIFFIIESHWSESAETERDRALIDLTFAVVNIVMYASNASNFILYCITGSRFRKELQKMFALKRSSRVAPAVADMEQRINLPARIYVASTMSTEVMGLPQREANVAAWAKVGGQNLLLNGIRSETDTQI